MHICFNALDYPSALGGGGVGNQVWLLARALVAAGHKVSVIALSQKGLPSESDDNGVRVYRIACGNIHWYMSRVPLVGALFAPPIRQLERSWATWRRIRAVHRQDRIDLVEGTETGMLFVAFWLTTIPFIARLHGEPYTFHKYTPGMKLTFGLRLCRRLQRAALRRARLLISPSIAHGREVALELGRRCPPIEVIPNILAPELLDAGALNRNNLDPLSNGATGRISGRIVLYVGRLEPNKGVPTLLAAARRFLADFPDAHLVLAGSPHPTMTGGELNRLLTSLPCSERVHILGHVAWRDLFSWYRRAAVCVLPSHYETFGLAALEPMAFGVPVVATRAGGLPEVVQEEVSGLLVAPGDEEGLAAGIARLLSDESLRRRLGAGAAAAAARHARADHLGDNISLYGWAKGTGPAERVVFSPHLDDAVLSCGGMIHGAAGRGEQVRVVTVFAGEGVPSSLSAFARHLHRKWDLVVPVPARREEDRRALDMLGVRQVEHWDFLEALYRNDESGRPLYSTYETLKGMPAKDDRGLVEAVFQRVEEQLATSCPKCLLYFPLALGQHVDHLLLFAVGLKLRAMGRDVRFYEDWPYAEAYRSIPAAGWLNETAEVNVNAKLSATVQYQSQMAGLGAVPALLRKRMIHYGKLVGRGRTCERYWHITPSHARRLCQHPLGFFEAPFVLDSNRSFAHRVGRLLGTFLRRRGKPTLPPGNGLCVVFGQAEFHRHVLERSGYLCWLRMDGGPNENSDHANRLEWDALPPESAAAVVSGPAARHFECAARTPAESYRVLEPGGVFCGSVVPEEWQATDTSSVEQILRQQGYQDVAVSVTKGGPAGWVKSFLAPLFDRRTAAPAECWRLPDVPGQVLFSARKPSRKVASAADGGS